MTLSAKQRLFTRMVSDLIKFAYDQGYELTFGEAWRSDFTAAKMAAEGKGIANSLHCQRLALDLNLFKDGVFLTETKHHEPLGLYWESIGGTWGGRFGDGNHYSLAHDGRK